jgi:hypothetical protein
MTYRRILLLIALVAGTTLVACGGDDEGASGGGSAGGTEAATTVDDTATACSALLDINTFDDAVEKKLGPVIQKLQSNPDAATVNEFIDELKDVTAGIDKDLPAVSEAYDKLKTGAPDDVVKDIDTIKSGTAEIVTILKRIDAPEDLQGFVAELTGNPAITAAGQATLRLDTYTKKTCGVGIAD